MKFLSKTQIDYPKGVISRFHYSETGDIFYIFSNTLKIYRHEWYEWFPNDIIYLQSEIDLIKFYGYTKELFVRTLIKKKKELAKTNQNL